jgi:xanthine/uracil permease
MSDEIKSPKLYRHFQLFALLVGVICTLFGILASIPALWGAGLALLVHGMVATFILLVEDRRTKTANG